MTYSAVPPPLPAGRYTRLPPPGCSLCGRAVTLEAAAPHFGAAPSKATALPSWLPAMARQ